MNPLPLVGSALVALCVQVPEVPQVPAEKPSPGILLPPSPAARAFGGVSPDTRPSALPAPPSVGLEGPLWRAAEPWNAWADAVRAEAATSEPDASRRAELAQIALAQQRWDDAWDHFAATGGDPGICAALLPRFLPGLRNEAGQEPAIPASLGGLVGPLPDGVLLCPSIPPPSVPASQVDLGRTWIERRTMQIEGLRVGAATLAMKVSLESDGLQVDFEHRGGGSARVRLRLPEPPDFQIRVAYVDWMRQDEVGVVIEIEILPGDETRTIFGRFRPRSIPWPTNLPEHAPRGLVEHGLCLAFSDQASDAPVLRAAGAGIGRVLGLPVSAGAEEPAGFAGVRIDLRDPAEARRKLQGIVTLAERFALRKSP